MLNVVSLQHLQEECMLRFKYLVDLVKKKKEKESTESMQNAEDTPEDSVNLPDAEGVDVVCSNEAAASW